MKLFKTSICTVLIICFLFPFAFATEITKDYQYAVDIVSQIGIMQNDDFMPKSYLKRSEAAVIATRLINMQDSDFQKTDTRFYDVSKSHWGSGHIDFLDKSGIMTGDSNGYFRPDEYISYNQLIKIILNCGGYEQIAKFKGGYPNGYNIIASEQGLFSGIESHGENYITREETAKIIFNAFDMRVLENDIILNDSIELTYKKDETFLNKNLKIYKSTGIIKANSKTNIATGIALNKGFIEVNGKKLGVGNTSAEELLGYNVEYYYKKDDNRDTDYIVAIREKNNNISMVLSDDYRKRDENFIYYNDKNDNMKKHKILPTATVIFNGEYKENPLDVYFDLKDGNITLIDNNDDDVSDIIIINYCVPYAVNAVGTSNRLIKGMYSQPDFEYGNLKNQGRDVAIFKNGAEIDISELNKWDVLDIYPSEISFNSSGITVPDFENSQIIKAEVFSNLIKGDVTQITSKDEYTINDNIYKISSTYNIAQSLKLAPQIKVGDTVTVAVDGLNNICAKKEDKLYDDEGQYFYITKAIYKNENIEHTLQIRGYLPKTGEWAEYYVKNTSILNLKANSSIDEVYMDLCFNHSTNLMTSYVVPQLTAIKLDNEGNINFIDTATINTGAETSENSLSIDAAGSMYYLNYTLDSNLAIAENALVIGIPVEGNITNHNVAVEKESEFTKWNYPPFGSNKNYEVEAYNIGDVAVANVIIYYKKLNSENSSIDYSTLFMMVDKVFDKLNDKKEPSTYLKGSVNGASQTCEIADDYQSNIDIKKLKKGDIIYYNTSNGKISFYNRIYTSFDEEINQSTSVKEYPNASKRFFAGANYSIGKIYAVDDEYMRIYFDTVPQTSGIDEKTISCFIKNSTYAMYDAQENKITYAFPADMRDYVSSSQPDKVLVYSSDAGFRGIFVIRNDE